jgi:hypothetical protein
VQVTITLTPTADGFADPVQLTVSGLASGLTGQFTQSTVTPGSTATTTTLTISSTTTAQLVPALPPSRFPIAPFGLLATLLPGGLLFARKTRWRTLISGRAGLILWLAVLGGVGALLSGCGGGFYFGATTGTTTNDVITVTATSGTDQHSTQITLGVQ